jgi:hypothetical protein
MGAGTAPTRPEIHTVCTAARTRHGRLRPEITACGVSAALPVRWIPSEPVTCLEQLELRRWLGRVWRCSQREPRAPEGLLCVPGGEVGRTPIYQPRRRLTHPRAARTLVDAWGCGAAGSAPESHSGGQGFESPQLHQARSRPTRQCSSKRLRCNGVASSLCCVNDASHHILVPSGPAGQPSPAHHGFDLGTSRKDQALELDWLEQHVVGNPTPDHAYAV